MKHYAELHGRVGADDADAVVGAAVIDGDSDREALDRGGEGVVVSLDHVLVLGREHPGKVAQIDE